MSLPNREFARPSALPIALDELYGIMRLRAFKSTGFPVNILAENDGTLRSQLILHDGTVQQRARSETNGSLIASLYGKNAGTLTAVNLESTGEQRNVLLGRDPANAIVSLRTDTQRLLRTREYEPYEYVASADLAATPAFTTLYTVPTSVIAVIEVELNNTGAVGVTVNSANIVPSGGTPGTSNSILTGSAIAAGSVGIRKGPYILHAGGTVQANRGAVGTSNGFVYIKEYSVGDTPTA